MRSSGYMLMLLLYVAALAAPALILLVCDLDAAAAGPRGKGDRGACPFAACGGGPGIICQRLF